MVRLAPVLVLCVLVASCASEPAPRPLIDGVAPTPTTAVPEVTCSDPPAAQISRVDRLLFAEPNPVRAGARLTLDVDAPADTVDMVGGAGAEWQCWDGSAWVGTHQLVRDWGEHDPTTVAVPPGATTTLPSIGLAIPNRHQIIVPDVAPGTYRIADVAFTGDGDEVLGFVIIEVIAD